MEPEKPPSWLARNSRTIVSISLYGGALWLLSKFRPSHENIRDSLDWDTRTGERTQHEGPPSAARGSAETIPPIDQAPTSIRFGSEPAKKRKFQLVQWLIFGATLFYAVVNFCQWRSQISSLKTAQRAWIVPVSPTMADVEVGKDAIITAAGWNNGPTPAIKVVMDGEVIHWLSGEPMPKPGQEAQWKGAVLGTQHGMKLPLEFIRVDEDAVKWLHSNYLHVRVRGKISYDDIFSHHHWTNYCFDYDDVAKAFLQCQEGFGMDGDRE